MIRGDDHGPSQQLLGRRAIACVAVVICGPLGIVFIRGGRADPLVLHKSRHSFPIIDRGEDDGIHETVGARHGSSRSGIFVGVRRKCRSRYAACALLHGDHGIQRGESPVENGEIRSEHAAHDDGRLIRKVRFLIVHSPDLRANKAPSATAAKHRSEIGGMHVLELLGARGDRQGFHQTVNACLKSPDPANRWRHLRRWRGISRIGS